MEPTRVVRSVVAFVRDEDDLVLLAAPTPDGPWSCLGGPVDDGEDLADAARHHALVDCGLRVTVGPVLATLTGERYRVLYECGADTTYEATVLAATVDGQAPGAPLTVAWFSPAELAGLYLDEFATAALDDLGMTAR